MNHSILAFSLTALVLCAGCAAHRIHYEVTGDNPVVLHGGVALAPGKESGVFIWNMRRIPVGAVAALVLDEIQAKGYEKTSSDKAYLWVGVYAFADESGEHALVVEIVERVSGCKVWLGTMRLPPSREKAGLKKFSVWQDEIKRLLGSSPGRY